MFKGKIPSRQIYGAMRTQSCDFKVTVVYLEVINIEMIVEDMEVR